VNQAYNYTKHKQTQQEIHPKMYEGKGKKNIK
jgi:hypothetical protein